jgi:hypothetical protein
MYTLNGNDSSCSLGKSVVEKSHEVKLDIFLMTLNSASLVNLELYSGHFAWHPRKSVLRDGKHGESQHSCRCRHRK